MFDSDEFSEESDPDEFDIEVYAAPAEPDEYESYAREQCDDYNSRRIPGNY